MDLPFLAIIKWVQPSVHPVAAFKMTHIDLDGSESVIVDDASVSQPSEFHHMMLPLQGSYRVEIEASGGPGAAAEALILFNAQGFECKSSQTVWDSAGLVASITYSCPPLYPGIPWQPMDTYFVAWNTSDPMNAELLDPGAAQGTFSISVPHGQMKEYYLVGYKDGEEVLDSPTGYLFGTPIILCPGWGDSMELGDFPTLMFSQIVTNFYVSTNFVRYF